MYAAPMAITKRKPKARAKARAIPLTAVYVRVPEGGYVAWISEAVGVHTQGETFEEARANLLDVIDLMLEDSPGQFGVRPKEPIPPGAFLETLFLVLPA